ncbi:MAG: isoaspartyl peptidase/L-asparaginase, partial [Thermoanaerobaculia bacterium]
MILGAAIVMTALTAAAQTPRIMLVMHGGAGTITRTSMAAEVEAQYRATLEQALKTGQAVLVRGGTSLDAVESSIRVLEDSP